MISLSICIEIWAHILGFTSSLTHVIVFMFCEMMSDTRLLLDVMNNAMKVATKNLLQLNKEACGLENLYNFSPFTSYLDRSNVDTPIVIKGP
jgi:tetrahydromethanopterin S-methyltransferase subunit H